MKTCEVCGKPLMAGSGKRKYCIECAELVNKQRVRENKEKYRQMRALQPRKARSWRLCAGCGKPFQPSINAKEDTLFCSAYCREKFRKSRLPPTHTHCAACGEPVYYNGLTVTRFCSRCAELDEKERQGIVDAIAAGGEPPSIKEDAWRSAAKHSDGLNYGKVVAAALLDQQRREMEERRKAMGF